LAHSLDDFRSGCKAGAAPAIPEGSRIRKQFAADSITQDDEQYTFTISTGAVDRQQDRIDVAGWSVDNFLRSGGPVLWMHDPTAVIGRAPWVRAVGGALKARVEFMPDDALAAWVRRAIDFGAVKSASVGFMPLPDGATWNKERGGIDFSKQELLEFSIVSVPANPEALLDAKAAGLDLAPLREWAERTLEAIEPGLWIPKTHAARVFKLLSEPRVTVDSTPVTIHAAAIATETHPNAPTCPGETPGAAPPIERFEITADEIRAATMAALERVVREEVRRHTGRLD